MKSQKKTEYEKQQQKTITHREDIIFKKVLQFTTNYINSQILKIRLSHIKCMLQFLLSIHKKN